MAEKLTNRPAERFRFERKDQTLLLIIGDLLSALLALVVSLLIWGQGDTWLGLTIDFLRERIPVWFYFLPVLWMILLVDSYDIRKTGNLRMTLRSLGIALLASLGIYLVIYFASEPDSMPRVGVALFLILAAFFTLLWRLLYVRLFSSASKQKRALIIGAGRAGTALAEIVADQDPPPFNLIGLIDDDPQKSGVTIQGFPVLGSHADLADVIENYNITDLILSISKEMNSGMFQTILAAQENGMNLATMQDTYESLTNRIPISLLESDWVIRSFIERTPTSGLYRLSKKIMDFILSLVGMVVLGILYPIIAILIRLDSKGPVIFRQTRLGLRGKPYTIFKFRTMKDSQDMEKEAMVTTTNDPRVTRIGRFLRKAHLDELPQIANVLRGEMSFVGPRSERSELARVFQREVPFYRARMLVKPGITGWAQIHQAYAETVEETAIKLEYDLYYIENASFLMDISIILRTVTAVLGFKGR